MSERVSNLLHELLPVSTADGGAHKTLAVAGTAVGTGSITLSPICTHVHVQIETAAIRLTVNGTTPTASLGARYDAGVEFFMSRAEWVASKWIREDATSATLQVMQYARPA